MSSSQDFATLGLPSPSSAAVNSVDQTASTVHISDSDQASQPSQPSQPTQPTPRALAHPFNPLKRQLSDNMEALIAQAKASKATVGSSAGQVAQSETIYQKLERELTCSICCELFKDPVTLLNCLHNFCGSCIVPWSENNSSCPSCRGAITGCRDAFALKPLIDMLVKEKPELAISEEEMKEFRDVYKPGQNVSFGAEYDGSEDEEDEEDEEEISTVTWDPCGCCETGDSAHPRYTCPNPILATDSVEIWRDEFKQHKRCYTCNREVPFNTTTDALRSAYCACCGISYCGIIFGQCDSRNSFLQGMRVASLYGPSSRHSFQNWFNNNIFEKNSLTHWIESDTNNYTWESLGEDMRDWLFRKNDDTIPFASIVPITPDSYLCPTCLPRIFDHYLTDYLISERERLGWTDIRTKCWYGKNCRTQRHNPDHCARLNHVCNETPQEGRREAQTTPRALQTSHTGSVRANMTPISQPPIVPSQITAITAMQPPSVTLSDDTVTRVPATDSGAASTSVAPDIDDPELSTQEEPSQNLQPSTTSNYQSRGTQTPPESTPTQRPLVSTQRTTSDHTPSSTPRRRTLLSTPSDTRRSLRRTESTPLSTPTEPSMSHLPEPEENEDEFLSHSQPLPSLSASPQLNRRRTFRSRQRRCRPEPGVDIRQIWADELELIEFMAKGRESSGSSLYPKLNDVRERKQQLELPLSQEEEIATDPKRRRLA
ncbi:hypothetical protein H072_2863 [Dactylellina haptotyla CBS 200.50]|uniref:RING-type domain-containing protein n=1 Tax=Dactylellina haptotyla (strain CBS 200.50) TaxID=1284197 RepID=S8AJH0_DACHA|nr:hypothetical protein H072_2863 [Dactylellina haptotyla CBS 200.50]